MKLKIKYFLLILSFSINIFSIDSSNFHQDEVNKLRKKYPEFYEFNKSENYKIIEALCFIGSYFFGTKKLDDFKVENSLELNNAFQNSLASNNRTLKLYINYELFKFAFNHLFLFYSIRCINRCDRDIYDFAKFFVATFNYIRYIYGFKKMKEELDNFFAAMRRKLARLSAIPSGISSCSTCLEKDIFICRQCSQAYHVKCMKGIIRHNIIVRCPNCNLEYSQDEVKQIREAEIPQESQPALVEAREHKKCIIM